METRPLVKVFEEWYIVVSFLEGFVSVWITQWPDDFPGGCEMWICGKKGG